MERGFVLMRAASPVKKSDASRASRAKRVHTWDPCARVHLPSHTPTSISHRQHKFCITLLGEHKNENGEKHAYERIKVCPHDDDDDDDDEYEYA